MIELWVIAEEGIGLAWLARNSYEVWILSVYLLDHRQDPRLRIVVSISSNAEIYLFGLGVSSISGHEAKERILGCLRDGIGGEAGGSWLRHVAGNTLETKLW